MFAESDEPVPRHYLKINSGLLEEPSLLTQIEKGMFCAGFPIKLQGNSFPRRSAVFTA